MVPRPTWKPHTKHGKLSTKERKELLDKVFVFLKTTVKLERAIHRVVYFSVNVQTPSQLSGKDACNQC